MTSKPILILFANLKGNLGDIAILHAMLSALGGRYPSREIHVFSLGHLPVDEERLAVWIRDTDLPFVFKGKTPYRQVRRVSRIERYLGLRKHFSKRHIVRLSKEFSKSYPVATAANYEAVFLYGGEQWGGHSSGINMFAILDSVSMINPNVFMFPFSVRKELHEAYPAKLLQSLFARIAAPLVVRDSDSGTTLRPFCPNVVVGSDCVFSLLGDTLSPPPTPPEQPLILLAVTRSTGSGREELIATVRALKESGLQVKLLTTCVSEDGESLAQIASQLDVDYVAPATWQGVVTEFRTSSLVVTNRLHCVIFSFFANVPVAPLRNREKVAGIAGDAGLTHSITAISELTPENANQCIRNSGIIRQEMLRYLGKVQSLLTAPWNDEA